jgi:hypothetical protein
MREALMHYVTLSALAGVEQARCRGDESSQGFRPKLKNGAMTVRHWMILQGEIAFGQIGNGDTLCSLASANVQQRLLPRNSPKRLKINSASELNDWNRWRSLGDSNPLFSP